MMDFNDYFDPVSHDVVINTTDLAVNSLIVKISLHTCENAISFDNCNIGLFAVTTDKRDCDGYIAADEIRKKIYRLILPGVGLAMTDFGNLKSGSTYSDTCYALRDVILEFLTYGIIPLVIAPDSRIIYSVYQAYEKLERAVNIASVNSSPELGSTESDHVNQPFLAKLIMNKSKYLFNYINIAYQNYFVDPDHLKLINDMLFDNVRLGKIRGDIREIEPVLRDTDIVSFSLNAVRHSDACGQRIASPNGLFGEEACQIAKYAGISDKVSSFCLSDLIPELDVNQQTAHLAAQILWHFLAGFCTRKKDYPFSDIKDYKRFIVFLDELGHDIVFYKSTKSDRWWLEVSTKKNDKKRNIIVACSYEDYQRACNQEIPDRWWKTYQKIC
ncbi:MAG: arginase [Bacteroidetes bacterium]|nr:arginase [Bacteroidota bacterium]